jgi:hypothetical protein
MLASYVPFRRIPRFDEIESLGWSRRTGSGSSARSEQEVHVFDGSAFHADIHHRTDQHPDHVVKEPIRQNLEFESRTPRPLTPLCPGDLATLVISR